MGASTSSQAGASGPSFTNQLSAMNPFASKPASGPTLGNAYNAQNANAKRAANAQKAANVASASATPASVTSANAPSNLNSAKKTNNAMQVAASSGSQQIERVSSRMNGGKRRNTRKGSRKNRKNCRR